MNCDLKDLPEEKQDEFQAVMDRQYEMMMKSKAEICEMADSGMFNTIIKAYVMEGMRMMRMQWTSVDKALDGVGQALDTYTAEEVMEKWIKQNGKKIR